MKITNEGFAIVERDTHIGKWVEENRRLDFDQNALPVILPHFKKDGTIINVGANIGAYAYAFRYLANEIICFEPNPEAYECLVHNLSRYNNFFLYPYAVSNKKTGYSVKCDNDNIGMAHIELAEDSTNETVVLDGLTHLKDLSMILMDCEGFELEVLQGSQGIISKFKPILVIEINNATLSRNNKTPNDIYKWLEDAGYRYRNIYKEQDLSGDQLDIICFPIN